MILVATTYYFKFAITILWNVDSYVSRAKVEEKNIRNPQKFGNMFIFFNAFSFVVPFICFRDEIFTMTKRKKITMAMWPASKPGFNWIFWGL